MIHANVQSRRLLWLKTNHSFVIHLLLYKIQDGKEHLVSIMLHINCKTIFLQVVINVTHFLKKAVPLTWNAVSVQTVEKAFMWSKLREVAPHGHENFPQLQGNIAIIGSPTSCFPPCEIQKLAFVFLSSTWETQMGFQMDTTTFFKFLRGFLRSHSHTDQHVGTKNFTYMFIKSMTIWFFYFYFYYFMIISGSLAYLSSMSVSSQVAEKVCSKEFTQQDRW